MVAAIIIDQFGLLKAPVHTINWQRVVGIVLLVVGVYLVKKY
ncbi:DMT family transporter [Acinetobacter baumannii]